VLSVLLVPSHPPSCCHPREYIPLVYTGQVQLPRRRLAELPGRSWHPRTQSSAMGRPDCSAGQHPTWSGRATAAYFNLLQTHCRNLKCVGLTPPPPDFVFEMAVSQSNILVRRRSAVKSRPWAPLAMFETKMPVTSGRRWHISQLVACDSHQISLSHTSQATAARAVRGLVWGTRGRRFESCVPEIRPIVASTCLGYYFW
jgi:hypothetical protein